MKETGIEIRRAETKDLDLAAELLDNYRQFYGRTPDLNGAKRFLHDRLENKDSIIFLAFVDDQALGFVQLYPSFSSISMQRVWILNDMLVVSAARKKGVGTALLKFVRQFALESGAKCITLETAPDNKVARQLYEANGYVQDTEYLHYSLSVEE